MRCEVTAAERVTLFRFYYTRWMPRRTSRSISLKNERGVVFFKITLLFSVLLLKRG